MTPRIGLRWTIGDVGDAGFEALRLSVHGAFRIFGRDAAYAILVNTTPLAGAQARCGSTPAEVQWLAVEPGLPEFMSARVGSGMAEGVAWKFVPLRVFPDRHELALDNDVILWEPPAALLDWLHSSDPAARLIACDVTPAHGKFTALCGPEPRNSGIRGTAPGFDLEAALKSVLARDPSALESELDEQGLQIAALSLGGAPHVVSLEDVTICSPFWPHSPDLGRCGAHFVGLNAKRLDWDYYGRSALALRLEHWRRRRPELYRRVGLAPPSR